MSFLGLVTIPRKLIVLFFLTTIGIVVSGLLYYQADNEHLKTEKQNELTAIADLKVGQIMAWRRERLMDAQIISGDRSIAWIVQLWLTNPSDEFVKRELTDWMASLQAPGAYSGVFLLDPNGNTLLSRGDQVHSPNPAHQEQIVLGGHTRSPYLSDLQAGGLLTTPHLDVVAPILDPTGSNTPAIAILILTLDPQEFLYPLIQSWPTPSQTAETLLVRREGDTVLYINDLRHRQNTALTLRLPLTNELLPASLAVRGYRGVVEGVDYRGENVLAVTRTIPDSPWFLIAKVDRAEIYAPMQANAQRIGFVISALIVAAGAGLGFFWRQQRVDFYREQLAVERERRLYAQRYENLARHANDIILLNDADGNIIDANERAVAAYSYTRDELLQRKMQDLIAPNFQASFGERLKTVEERNGWIYESVHVKKDGSLLSIEASARVVEVDGTRFFQTIIRDISERKAAEAALHSQNQYLAALQETTLELVSQLDLDHLLKNIVTRAGQLVGTDSGFLDLLDLQADRMIPHVGLGLLVDSLKSPIQLGEGAAGKVWQTRQPLLIENYHDWPHRVKALSHSSLGPMAVVPLLSGEKILGVLGLAYDVALQKVFGQESIDLLTQFARLASIAIENAQLYSTAQRELAERGKAEQQVNQLNAELEQRVVLRTAELETANKELEAFSYSVSHDLRAPLRALDGFSRILQEDHAFEISGQATRYLDLIRQNALQMGRLIDDLLTFSRLNRQPLTKQSINMVGLVTQALESLRFERDGREILVEVGDLPACQGDPALLLQVWVNLLSNAFKYTRKCPVAQIVVGSKDMPGENNLPNSVVYFVKDNGAGFDMRYVGKLFGVFQRLHRAEEYEGTGVGLAIIQRIIHRHGGRVWAEAQVDRGARFYFTLNDADAAEDVQKSISPEI